MQRVALRYAPPFTIHEMHQLLPVGRTDDQFLTDRACGEQICTSQQWYTMIYESSYHWIRSALTPDSTCLVGRASLLHRPSSSTYTRKVPETRYMLYSESRTFFHHYHPLHRCMAAMWSRVGPSRSKSERRFLLPNRSTSQIADTDHVTRVLHPSERTDKGVRGRGEDPRRSGRRRRRRSAVRATSLHATTPRFRDVIRPRDVTVYRWRSPNSIWPNFRFALTMYRPIDADGATGAPPNFVRTRSDRIGSSTPIWRLGVTGCTADQCLGDP